MVLTAVPAVAPAGADTVVVTSASGEIAVVSPALSGSALAPWLVVVPSALLMVTAPLAGAVYATPSVIVELAPRLPGIPLKVTTPVPAL